MLIVILALSAAVHVQDTTPSRTPRRPPVTPAALASAFRDAAARDLFTRARRTRLEQDSALTSYDAKVRQRLSVSAGVGKFGPERLVYRHESAARVQWQRGSGAHIEMTGARVAIPVVGSDKVDRDAVEGIVSDAEMSPIPYFPGSETLWAGGGTAKAEIDERNLVNPLAEGAESFYTYEAGDSASFRLPAGVVIRIRELKVRPRSPKWNLAVGSLWFDVNSGHLVRATYRLAAPAGMGISVQSDDSTKKAPKLLSFLTTALLSPNTAEISAIVVEYGLYEGRFWLPRVQSMQGFARVAFARIPMKYESSFEYASVNSSLALSEIHVDTTRTDALPSYGRPPEGLDPAARQRWRDSARAAYNVAKKARDDSTRAGMRVGSMRQCDSAQTRVITRYRYDAKLPVQVRIPCDVDKLTQSTDLPASIYDPGEELFGAADRDRVIADALSMAAQAPISFGALPAPKYQFGLSMTRYNRVEGFSTGLVIDQQIGGGYSARALGRFGASDRIPNAELSLARANGSRTMRVNGYTRLVPANEWGDPLSFGSSLSAFLFGRDEGFYYRAAGAELLWTSQRGVRLEWRAFAERQRSALQTTTFSVGGAFVPNIIVEGGRSAGASVRLLQNFGVDPHGFRAFTDLRLEGAGGDSVYGRGALDVTVSRELSHRVAAALTVAGGSSIGAIPMQRRWFLGGTPTIRGQSPDMAQSGNAFWLSRMELARQNEGYRASLFGDIGWAGDRRRASEVGRPLSGIGVGISGFDGMIRLDVARGLYPREQTRVNLYLDARF